MIEAAVSVVPKGAAIVFKHRSQQMSKEEHQTVFSSMDELVNLIVSQIGR